jgi:hypothetical protein
VGWSGAWPTLDLVQLRDSLDGLIKLVDQPARSQPDEVSRAISRFLVVRSSGYLEQASEECCRIYVDSHAPAQVSAYGSSWLGKGSSPTPDHLVRLVRRFDRTWADALEAFLRADDELLWRELSLLVDRRNLIAHGLSEGVTQRKALDLAGHAKVTADWFITRFDPR